MKSPHCYDNGCILDYPHNCICGADMHVPGTVEVIKDAERVPPLPTQKLPPPELLKKLSRIQADFPDGFVIFIGPQKERSTWVGVFRWNPKFIRVIEAVYQKVMEGQMPNGNQN